MNTTRTERGPDFVPVVVHVPDHGRLTCVFYRALMRAKMKQIEAFFPLVFFLFRVLNPSRLKGFPSSFFFPLLLRARKRIKRTRNARRDACFVYKKRQHERYFLPFIG